GLRSTFYMKVEVTGIYQTLKNEKPSAAALKAINENGFAEFAKGCGDSFVYQIQSGAEFLVKITYNSSEEQKAHTLEAGLNTHFTTVEADADLQQSLKTISS